MLRKSIQRAPSASRHANPPARRWPCAAGAGQMDRWHRCRLRLCCLLLAAAINGRAKAEIPVYCSDIISKHTVCQTSATTTALVKPCCGLRPLLHLQDGRLMFLRGGSNPPASERSAEPGKRGPPRRESKSRPDQGIVTFRHRGLNQRDGEISTCLRQTSMLKRGKA
jgi:hypothetical protein